jgi:hypothetical protein
MALPPGPCSLVSELSPLDGVARGRSPLTGCGCTVIVDHLLILLRRQILSRTYRAIRQLGVGE